MPMPKLQRVADTNSVSGVGDWVSEMKKIVLGQDHIIEQIAPTIEIFHAGLHTYQQPVGTFLLLGKTGMGKTHFVKSLAEVFHRDPSRIININCAEYQSPHEVARLIGAPPGYLGHRETTPVLAKTRIDALRSEYSRLRIILLDEFEKANEGLHQSFLSVFDQGVLTMGDGQVVRFDECIFFLTSNLGLSSLTEYRAQLGYNPPKEESFESMQRNLVEIARRKLSPEFMNRLDDIILFRTLTEEDLKKIVEKQVREIALRLGQALRPLYRDDKELLTAQFRVTITTDLYEVILKEGFDKRYGARPMLRALKKHVTLPLARFIQDTSKFDPGTAQKPVLHTFRVTPDEIVWKTNKPTEA